MDEKQKQTDLKSIQKKDGRAYSVRANRDRFFFPNEWMKFYELLKENQKLTFLTLLNTGARINEVRHIKVADIDFERKNIILRVTKVKAKKKEKNPRPRTISISSKFVKVLKKHIQQDNLKGEDYIPILSTPAANIAMKKTLQRAEIKDWYMFSLHNIRKTLGNWLKALGIDGAEICLRLGHDYNTFIHSYGSPDIFSYEDLRNIRILLDDLYDNYDVRRRR
jgi:integrase